jgi:signal transduction histidine kinase
VELDKVIDESQQLLSDLAAELRTMSHVLHPPLLEEGGLASAVRWFVTGLADRSGMEIKLSIASDFPRLPAEMELAMFRVVQECLTNADRHSGSRSAAIRLFCQPGSVNIEVRDHGKGIAPERMAELKSQSCGVGIRGMQERLRPFGGDLSISSNNRGTKVAVRVPAPVNASIAVSLQSEPQMKATLPS